MPRANAVVDTVAHIGPALRGAVGGGPAARAEVVLSGGRVVALDLSDPRGEAWLAVLTGMQAAGLAAYVEVDPTTAVVQELLCPVEVLVGELTEIPDGLDVELVVSQARHVLRRDHPDYAELLRDLRSARAEGAPVLVTETLDGHEIIDVRLLPKVPVPVQPAPPEPETHALVGAVPLSVAQRMFDLVSARTCCSGAPSAPCVPFTYPDDGCWGRAHEMCRLMIGDGVQPQKVWIYGNLTVNSANKPDCTVHWGWHVAPTLEVAVSGGARTYVIDPSLFAGPVPRETWSGVQGDPSATLVPTAADVFHRSFGGGVQYDPTYAGSNAVLATYRAQLQLRSASPTGPPPYPQCQVKPPGVQFFGSLAAGATGRWFTAGWPAAWHVAWTVVPTSVCPGAPQVSWSVAVERANAAEATYWITVRNRSPRMVRFEGRFDVLSR